MHAPKRLQLSDADEKPYASPARTAAAQARRRRIIAAASELFARDGFEATTMAVVAAAAGVSERTVYLAFATKAALLNECIRAAVRGDGDDERTPMLARGAWQAALNAPPEQMLGLIADATAELMIRAARLLAAGESVGLGDPQLHEFSATAAAPRPTPPANRSTSDSSITAAGAHATTPDCSSKRSQERSPTDQQPRISPRMRPSVDRASGNCWRSYFGGRLSSFGATVVISAWRVTATKRSAASRLTCPSSQSWTTTRLNARKDLSMSRAWGWLDRVAG